jgi:5-methylcytosine-specific restriction protein A
MPSHNCKWPTCSAIVPTPGYCPAHAHHAGDDARHYDHHQRDQQSKRFYNSKAWQQTRLVKLAQTPVCEHCGRELATTVHHRLEVKDIRDEQPHLLTAFDNLESCCAACHMKWHKRKRPA